MEDDKNPEQHKPLEMRVAELEDKLSKIYITETIEAIVIVARA